MRITHALFAVAAVLAGCVGMMTGTDGMRGAVADAIAEDQQHLTGARAASSLPAMLDEVDRHASRTAVIMDDMGAHMSSMQHCSGIGSMIGLRDGMRAELDAHVGTMHAEIELASARAAVEDHVATMGAMLDDMGAMLDRTHCGGW
jgi:hypothetical protein